MDPSYVAAVDLGSHTFCAVIARTHGAGAGFRVVDIVKERVALARGIDEESGALSRDAEDRALSVLRRFGARLRDFEPSQVRVTGTSALRVTPGLETFQQAAERAIGFPIEIVDGETEARLVFIGVAHGGVKRSRRLVVDLGGGSTEVAIGQGLEPSLCSSLPFGHLERMRRIADRGRYDADSYAAARAEVVEAWNGVRAGWDPELAEWREATGAGGLIRSVLKVLRARDEARQHIRREALRGLEGELIEVGDVEKLTWDGLSARRRLTFPGGVLALAGMMDALGIARLEVSWRGLREGVLHELLDQSTSADLRQRTALRLERRYGIDTAQGERVRRLAIRLADQEGSLSEPARELLEIGARLHELGQAMRYRGYHKEGGRVIRASELPGFSTDQKMSLAALVRLHRPTKKIKKKHWRRVSERARPEIVRATLLLRLAVLLCRARRDEELPVELKAKGDEKIRLRLPGDWLEERPLVVADLEKEARKWDRAGFSLKVRFD